jgi:hypothetical protein
MSETYSTSTFRNASNALNYSAAVPDRSVQNLPLESVRSLRTVTLIYEPSGKRAVSFVFADRAPGAHVPKRPLFRDGKRRAPRRKRKAGRYSGRSPYRSAPSHHQNRAQPLPAFWVIASMTTASNAHCVNSLREGRPRRPTTQNNDVRLVANGELSS